MGKGERRSVKYHFDHKGAESVKLVLKSEASTIKTLILLISASKMMAALS